MLTVPRVSIITVVKNNVQCIDSCIRSVLSQKYPEIEHIVIDGGSTDGTLDIINRHSGSLSKVVSGPDKGMYDAMNKGIDAASGDIVGILNADDLYEDPFVVDSVVAAMGDDKVDTCYGDLVYVDADDPHRVFRYWHSGVYDPRRFYQGWMPPHPAFFVKRRVYEQHGMFNLALGTAADYELMLRLLLKHHVSAVYLSRVLVRMRTGGASNASLRKRLIAHRMDRQAWRVNELTPKPWTLLFKPLRKLGQYFQRPSSV